MYALNVKGLMGAITKLIILTTAAPPGFSFGEHTLEKRCHTPRGGPAAAAPPPPGWRPNRKFQP